MIEIRPSTVDEILAHAESLFEENWDENDAVRKLPPPDPDVAQYQLLEEMGLLLVLGAWDGAVLAGYSVSVWLTHLHYKGWRYCANNLLFVAKAYRTEGRAGLRLIAETERQAQAGGAEMMLWSTRCGTPMEKLLRLKGYCEQDTVFRRMLSAP